MEERCSVDVSERGFWHVHRCARKAVVFVSGKGYCKQHNPGRLPIERAVSAECHKLHDDRMRWDGARFFEALLKIAQGHNDPRSLARETIKHVTGWKE